MNFGLLAPAALIGLALLAIPILLHIFKPRKVRVTPFSSLRWLRASQHRMSRRIRWHQVLLFLLRAAFVTLLVLALARPILSWNRGDGSDARVGAKKIDRFVIVDLGSAMDYRAGTRAPPIELARRLAGQLVEQTGAGDRATIILAGRKPQALGPLAADPGSYVTRMSSVQTEPGAADLGEALRLIAPLLGTPRTDAAVEIDVLTANRAASWSQGTIARFVADERLHNASIAPRVKIVDLGPTLVQNAWIADVRLLQSDAPARRAIRARIGAVGTAPQTRTVRLTRLPGLPDATRTVDVAPDGIVQVEFELPLDYDLKGKAAELRLEPADNLAADNVYWLPLDSIAAAQVLIIEPQATQVAELQPGYHLRFALSALAYATPGSIHVVTKSDTAVRSPDIAHADVIMLAHVPRLSDEVTTAIANRVRSGAGIAVFLAPGIDASFYNTKFFDPLHPSQSILSGPVGTWTEVPRVGNTAKGTPRLSQIQTNHPLFAGLLDPIFGDLSQVQFRGWYPLAIQSSEQDDHTLVIARIGDAGDASTPAAIVDRAVGNGRAVLFNLTASDVSSDLPRRASFVPVIDRLMNYLVGGARRGLFDVAQAIRLPLREASADTVVTITQPDGKTLEPIISVSDGRASVHLDGLTVPGVYQVQYSGTQGPVSFPFVVQPLHADFRLARADERTLQQWWSPQELQIVNADSATSVGALASQRVILDRWIIALACLFLAAEMFFVHWLCPKVNPTVNSTSTVAGRGFFSTANVTESSTNIRS